VGNGSERAAPRLEVALETSRRAASLAVALGDAVVQSAVGERAHASDLLPCLETALARLGVARGRGPLPSAALYAGIGPGRYTGLRVGLATALGLARGTGAEVFALTSFEALAWAELEPGCEGTVACDARAGRFYHARYRRDERDVRVLAPPSAVDARELLERCRLPGPILGHPELSASAGFAGELLARLRSCVPSAAAVLALGRVRRAAGALHATRTLEPLYLGEFGARAAQPER